MIMYPLQYCIDNVYSVLTTYTAAHRYKYTNIYPPAFVIVGHDNCHVSLSCFNVD